MFSMMFVAMLTSAFKDSSVGVKVCYRIDHNFKLRRLQRRTKIQFENICELLFADECDRVSPQKMKYCMYTSLQQLATTISNSMPEVLYQAFPRTEQDDLSILYTLVAHFLKH